MKLLILRLIIRHTSKTEAHEVKIVKFLLLAFVNFGMTLGETSDHYLVPAKGESWT